MKVKQFLKKAHLNGGAIAKVLGISRFSLSNKLNQKHTDRFTEQQKADLLKEANKIKTVCDQFINKPEF